MSQPPDYETLKKSRNLPPPPTDTERYRAHKIVAHTKAFLRDQPCPVPPSHNCPHCQPTQEVAA